LFSVQPSLNYPRPQPTKRTFERLRLVVGSLELRHVELHHCHHSFHHSLHLPGVPITDQLGESSRDNLPGETEGVFDPTALRGLGR
jgi:hypothetical protein